MEQRYTYEKHCEEMRARGHDPMSEQHFREMQEQQEVIGTVRPKVRPSTGGRPKEPILDLCKDIE